MYTRRLFPRHVILDLYRFLSHNLVEPRGPPGLMANDIFGLLCSITIRLHRNIRHVNWVSIGKIIPAISAGTSAAQWVEEVLLSAQHAEVHAYAPTISALISLVSQPTMGFLGVSDVEVRQEWLSEGSVTSLNAEGSRPSPYTTILYELLLFIPSYGFCRLAKLWVSGASARWRRAVRAEAMWSRGSTL